MRSGGLDGPASRRGGAELLDSAAGVERKGWFAGWSKARQCAGCLR